MKSASTMMVSGTTEVTKQHAVPSLLRGLLWQALGLVLMPYPGWEHEVAKMKWQTQPEGAFYCCCLTSVPLLSCGLETLSPLGSPLQEGGHKTKPSIFLLQGLDLG